MMAIQESPRKDVQWLFRVLQGRFKILRQEFHEWSDDAIVLIVQTCVILHDMIVSLKLSGQIQEEQTEHGDVLNEFQENEVGTIDKSSDGIQIGQRSAEWMRQLVDIEGNIRCTEQHIRINQALEEHIWQQKGNKN